MSCGEESESEEQARYHSDEPKGKMSEYEKQRHSRIAENKARLEALGISKAAKALVGSSKRRGKPNPCEEEDDDYRPGEADGDDEVEETDDSEYNEKFLGNPSSLSCKRKSKASAPKRKVLSKKNLSRSDEGDDDLNKAIALSLQGSEAVAGGSAPSKKKRNGQDTQSWKKKKPELMMSKMQMTEDELVIYFYHFDEAGKGFISLRDVAKMATVHDFTWTDEELQDMIRCFDMDKDEKLSLDEFSKIVTRCRMLKES